MNEFERNFISNSNPREQINFETKVASVDDWEELRNLRLSAIDSEKSSFDEPREVVEMRSKEEWKKILESENSFVVLEKAGKEVIGMASAKEIKMTDLNPKSKNHFLEREGIKELWYIGWAYIKPNFRSNASGSTMRIFEKMLEEARDRKGPEYACFIVLKENPNLPKIIKMSEKYGFIKDEQFLKSGNPFFIAKISEMKELSDTK